MFVGGEAKSNSTCDSTIYRWLDEPAFYRAYRTTRRQSFAQTIALTQKFAAAAVHILVNVMADDSVLHTARRLSACGGDTWVSVRNRALTALLHRAGLRINEAIWLAPKDVDLEAGAVRVLRGKGGRSRTVGIDPGGAAIVGVWVERRDALGFDGAAPLLCTWSGGRLHAGSVRRWLQRVADEAGIEKRVHPHGLRHTHAAELREEGMDIGIISKQLGRQSIALVHRNAERVRTDCLLLESPIFVPKSRRRR